MLSRRLAWALGMLVGATFVVVTPHAANAYTVKNLFSSGCHEAITSAALRTVRTELATADAIPATPDEQALIGDLQFVPEPDMMDLGGATLLVAVRDNDLKGRASGDATQLAAVHGNPDGQQEHCLRTADQDEPGGSEAAVAACRAFVRGRIVEALDGLDAAGKPDPTRRTSLTVHLSLRGKVDAPLPTYYVKMGQAIHAIEDSFSHTYRTPDSKQITVVLNWIDKTNGTLVESRDGPPHVSELDRCDDADAVRTERHALAVQAASGVLRATLDSKKTPDQKMAAVDTVLDTYLGYSPGCTPANAWCNAPEHQYPDASACGCHVGKIDGGSGATLAGALAAIFAVVRRRRRAVVAPALAIAGALLFVPVTARAQSTTTTTAPAPPTTPATAPAPAATITTTTIPAGTAATPPTTATTVATPTTTTTIVTTPTVASDHAPAPPTVIPVKEPGPLDPTKTTWGAALGASGSIDNPAVAGSAGLRLRLSKHWSFGLDGEYNPWLALNGTISHASVVNMFGSAMLRFPLAYENFNLRTTVSAGASYLLSSLYGAPSGSLGPYLGVSFLGVEWKLSRSFFFIINPVNFAFPMPQIKGVPLAYPQYRFTLGIEVYLG
jgi:uncharacterized protein (TIGR03382 family)